ncbi:MAG: hypothetical protein WCR52_11485 [Bacteroidota bacterium]|uniref:hypothetical protein n=1 Tax=Runella sp. TaxID=1960881 RepID=UPI0030188A24
MGQIYDTAGNPASDSFLNNPQNFKLPFNVIEYRAFNREVFAKYEALVKGKFAYYDRIKNDLTKAEATEKMRLELDVMLSIIEVVEDAERGYISAWATIRDTWQAELVSEKRRAQENFKLFLAAADGEKMFLDMAVNSLCSPSKQAER